MAMCLLDYKTCAKLIFWSRSLVFIVWEPWTAMFGSLASSFRDTLFWSKVFKRVSKSLEMYFSANQQIHTNCVERNMYPVRLCGEFNFGTKVTPGH